MADKLTKDDVAYVARLARLSLSEEELEMFAGQLSAVLEHADALCQLDISEVEPTAHALKLENVLRPDELRPGCERDEVLASAPSAESGRFKVPRILGEAP